MVRLSLEFLGSTSLTPPTDTTSKLPNLDAQSSWLLDFQHQSPRDSLVRALYLATPILDMALRENQPTVSHRANEPIMGDSTADRARNPTGEVPTQQLGSVCD